MLAPLLLLAVAAGPFQEPETLPELEAADFSAWRDYLLPDSEEAAFEEVAWFPSFAEGIREADSRDRPLLLWAMNGHPLGCT